MREELAYPIGVDLGATRTAAAVSFPDRVEPASLGAGTAFLPTVAAVAAEGSLVFGEDAVALSGSDRVVRQFIRRVGDDTPLLLGGVAVTAEALAAQLVSSVVDTVAAASGGPARRVAITHPAGWGSHRVAALRSALSVTGLGAAVLLSSAQASALAYADREPVADGDLIAVYDLGGSGLDAAVVRRTDGGEFVLAGRAEEVEVGGLDFDELVFEHVRTALGEQWTALDGDDPAVLAGVARLRAACTEAKERLSTDTEAWIPVCIPGIDAGSGGAVRLVRAELEEMIRPAVEETAAALLTAIGSAAAEPDDLAVVLLTGGSARIPLVTQVVSEVLGRAVTVADNPKVDAAAGAALAAAGRSAALAVAAALPEADSPGDRLDDSPGDGPAGNRAERTTAQTLILPRQEIEWGEDEYPLDDDAPPPPPRSPVVILPEQPAHRRRRYLTHSVLAGAGVGLAVLLVGGWLWSTNVSGSPSDPGAGKAAANQTPSPSSSAPARSSPPASRRPATRRPTRSEPSRQPTPAATRSPATSNTSTRPVAVVTPSPSTVPTPSRTPTGTPSTAPPSASPSPSPTAAAAGSLLEWLVSPPRLGGDNS